MLSLRSVAVASALGAAFAATTLLNACINCEAWLQCEEEDDEGTTGAGGSGGAGGEDGGIIVCDPSLASGPVDASCGVFVAPNGDDADDGSPTSPVATFAKAISLAAKSKPVKPVYACAQVFSEAVSVPQGVTVYGGLDCAAGWAYVGAGTRTTISPPAGQIPLKLVKGGAGTTHIVDIIAQAAAAPQGGQSSIAAIADSVPVSFERVDLIAGDGSDGEKGETPSGSVGPANADDPAIAGNKGSTACMGGGQGNLGAQAKTNASCPASIGGGGGDALGGSGGSGKNGQPLPSPNPNGFGLGGAGDSGAGCLTGKSGNVGLKGAPGAGATLTDLGAISLSGFTGISGGPGVAGAPGGGGGGGGAAMSKQGCYGASGGSGGAGGCGGGGGGGGAAGGASIALISLGASLTFKGTVLIAGNGGRGGDGAPGQAGGIGGTGGIGGAGNAGMGVLAACGGGNGGSGAFGGRGGGGRGGHSIAIAHTGSSPKTTGTSITIGMAGKGGAGDGALGPGADGAAENTVSF